MMFNCRRQLVVSAVLLSLVFVSAYASNPRRVQPGAVIDKYEVIKNRPDHPHGTKTLHSGGIGFPVD